jgi:hypothetical protein
MQELPAESVASFKRQLDRAWVAEPRWPDCFQWVRFYLYFCQEYGYPPAVADGILRASWEFSKPL